MDNTTHCRLPPYDMDTAIVSRLGMPKGAANLQADPYCSFVHLFVVVAPTAMYRM